MLSAHTNFDDGSAFQPCNSKMLATHKKLVDSFRNLSWPVNKNAGPRDAILIGRYPEDTYYDGGAWPLCTFACAEMLYDAVAQFKRSGTLNVDSISLSFFQDLSPNIKLGEYKGTQMDGILTNVTNYADGFVRAVQVCTRQTSVPCFVLHSFALCPRSPSSWV